MVGKLKLTDIRRGMTLTHEQALQVFGADIVRSGGGWADFHGLQVYGCDGTHKCGHRGFKILLTGGLR